MTSGTRPPRTVGESKVNRSPENGGKTGRETKRGPNAERTHLDICDVTLGRKIHPVSLIDFWTDQEVEVCDLVVFTHQGSSEPELAMRLHLTNRSPELISRDGVNL